MANVEHINCSAANREDDAVLVRTLAIEKVSNFFWKVFVFWSEATALRIVGQRMDGFK